MWSDSPYREHGWIRRCLDTRLEKQTLRQADALVAVSPPWAELLGQRYEPRAVSWIPNGFDPDEFPREVPPAPSESFSITYTGTLYGGKRTPELLFAAVRELIDDGILPASRLRIHFYSPVEPWLPALVRRYDLSAVVQLHGFVPRAAAIRAQRESQLLLLLRWDSPGEAHVVSGKLFEYLGSRRPILALGGPPGVATEILTETRAGVHVTSRSRLRELLVTAFESFERYGSVPDAGDESAISMYNQIEMARKFAEVLERTA